MRLQSHFGAGRGVCGGPLAGRGLRPADANVGAILLDEPAGNAADQRQLVGRFERPVLCAVRDDGLCARGPYSLELAVERDDVGAVDVHRASEG
jgi:hypothetical protein